jgi:ABC-type transporter Mla subunit MlaD
MHRTTNITAQERGVDLWLKTWIALAAIVAATVVGYLILISNSLVGINTHLTAAGASVADVNGNTKTLPGQVQAVNRNLTAIDEALKSIPSQAGEIQTNLESVRGHGVAINRSLTNASGNLANTARDLHTSAPMLDEITSDLDDTSDLLTSILKSTDKIETNLVGVAGDGPAGALRINSTVVAINDGLRPTEAGLSDVLGGLGSINGHLLSACQSPVLQLLGSGNCAG